jgi:hypothetical protein
LVLIIVVPLSRSKRSAKGPLVSPATVDTTVANSFVQDLMLENAEFQAGSRTMKGMVINKSGRAYRNVVISYTMRDEQGHYVTAVSAEVAMIGPRAKAAFETNPIPPGARRIDLREITGTPR